jgi:hypothetical protein
MAIQIPMFQSLSSDFTQNIDLESVNVEIRLMYNTRTESWMMQLKTDNYEINGIKLVKNFPLLWKHKALFPEVIGDFIVKKISDDININDLNYDNLGIYFGLFYITQAELEEWKVYYGIDGV